MADNVSTTAGVFATDDIGGAHYERVKITLGADGVNDGDVHSSNPLPVDLRNISSVATQATLGNVSTFTNSTNTMLLNVIASSTSSLWVQAQPGAAQSSIGGVVVIKTGLFTSGGTQIDSFGGGTQYVDGNTTTLPTGTVMLWKSAVSTIIPVSSSNGLPVNVVAGSLNANTEYVEGATTTLATGITMLWKSAVSTLTAVTTSLPLPIGGTIPTSTNTLLINLSSNTASTNALVSTGNLRLTDISSNTASTNALLSTQTLSLTSTVSLTSSNKLHLETISTLTNSSNTLLVQLSSNTASTNALISTHMLTNSTRLNNVSTFTNSTNTLLVQVSSNTASSNSLLSTIALRLAPVPTGIYVQPIPVSSNGLTPFMTLDCNNSTQQVVSTAATLYGIYFGNVSSKVSYLKIWDGVSSATFVSSTAATLVIPVPGNSTDVIAGNFNAGNSHGIRMSTGICIAGVFGPNNGNSTQIGISTLIVNLFYKS
mgnify:CR=1 FL=1